MFLDKNGRQHEVFDLTGDSDDESAVPDIQNIANVPLTVKEELDKDDQVANSVNSRSSSPTLLTSSTIQLNQGYDNYANNRTPETTNTAASTDTASADLLHHGQGMKEVADPVEDSGRNMPEVSREPNPTPAEVCTDLYKPEDIKSEETDGTCFMDRANIPDLPKLPQEDLPDDDMPGDLSADESMDIGPLEALRLYNQANATVINDEDGPEEMDDRPVGCDDQHEDAHDWASSLVEEAAEIHAKQAADFAALKETYLRKKAANTLTPKDEIEFLAAQEDENRRLENLKRSQEQVDEVEVDAQAPIPPGYVEAESLFFPEPPQLPQDSNKKKRSGPKPRNRVNAQETRDAMAVGTSTSARKRAAPAPEDSTRPRKKRQTRTGAGRRGRQPILSNLTGLGRTNIIQQAQANANAPDMPRFTAKNKAKALEELVASIPSADRAQAVTDKVALSKASTKFRGTGAVKSDGKGGWKLKNMESSLYNHQLLGAAFLRDRENGTQKPLGGMVCDEMGFGKTVQMM